MDSRFLLLAAVAALIIIRSAHDAGALDEVIEHFVDPEDQTGSMLDQIPDFEDITNIVSDAMTTTDEDQAARNEAAFLAGLRKAEGTDRSGGYNALFGWPAAGRSFSSYAAHPRQFFNYTDKAGKTIRTSAAGAYQITATTNDGLVRNYGFTDFSPATQDAMALALIKEKGALADVRAGRFETAVNKVRKIWASLPGSNVNQPERSMDYVKQAYLKAGGILA